MSYFAYLQNIRGRMTDNMSPKRIKRITLRRLGVTSPNRYLDKTSPDDDKGSEMSDHLSNADMSDTSDFDSDISSGSYCRKLLRDDTRKKRRRMKLQQQTPSTSNTVVVDPLYDFSGFDEKINKVIQDRRRQNQEIRNLKNKIMRLENSKKSFTEKLTKYNEKNLDIIDQINKLYENKKLLTRAIFENNNKLQEVKRLLTENNDALKKLEDECSKTTTGSKHVDGIINSKIIDDTAIENAECPICKNVFNKPVTSSRCGHVYCRECIETWRENPLGNCPVCRDMITEIIELKGLDEAFELFRTRKSTIPELVPPVDDIDDGDSHMINLDDEIERSGMFR
ncbi:hypothetical protein PvNV_034 [Penaeus vannamei nudivirus]|nr:hypothetical protein PvSNPV_034 [Penaeus vannamei nucleopolyhedrovirus]